MIMHLCRPNKWHRTLLVVLGLVLWISGVSEASASPRSPFSGTLRQIGGLSVAELPAREPATVRLAIWSPQLGSVSVWLHSRQGRQAPGDSTLASDPTLLRGIARVPIRGSLSMPGNSGTRITRLATIPVAGALYQDPQSLETRLSVTLKTSGLSPRRALRIFRFETSFTGSKKDRPSPSKRSAHVRTVSTRALGQRECQADHAALAQQSASASAHQNSGNQNSGHNSPRVAFAQGDSSAATQRAIELVTDCDSACSQSLGGSRANGRIEEFVNEINTIYPEELGLTLVLKDQMRRTSDEAYPRSISVAFDLLKRFQTVGADLPRADVKHLLTGRSLDFDVLGLAFIDAVCDSREFFAYGLTAHANSLLLPIIMAHEIGHNLGGRHDPSNQGIMSARLGLPPPTSFSTSSRAEINSYVSNNALSCLDEVLPELTFQSSFRGTRFRSAITLPSGYSGCTLQLFSGLSRSRQRKLLYTRDLSSGQSQSSIELFEVSRVRPQTTGEAIRVFLYPRASCTSGGDLAGPLRSVRVNAKRSSRSLLKGARRWIGRLSSRLESE